MDPSDGIGNERPGQIDVERKPGRGRRHNLWRQILDLDDVFGMQALRKLKQTLAQ
jgi:hypothetical protein